MKRTFSVLWMLLTLAIISCDDQSGIDPVTDIKESTITISQKAVIKVLPYSKGWLTVQETLQPQYLVTQPKRELVWFNTDFNQLSRYHPSEGWSLIDAVVHPSGQVSVAIINLDVYRNPMLEIKIVRLGSNGGKIAELLLQPIPLDGERIKYFPASLDRIRLESFSEDVYVIARWDYNNVEASRLGFSSNQFHVKWQTLVEPDAFAGSIGIIGGGYDNFHQGDRYFFVYSGVDPQGNLYVGVPSHEDLIFNHDAWFNENLTSETNPGSYDWGVAILTKLSNTGKREYARLVGKSTKKRLINIRVGNGEVYFVGRVKIGAEPNSWDAWILSINTTTGNFNFENQMNIQDGDMFWDVNPIPNGGVIAVGTKAYLQNPNGLSVSDARLATAVIIDNQGAIVKEIDLPQGPAERGSEAMFVKLFENNKIVFAGVHNAPGTHAAVYCDGFIAVRDLIVE